MLEALSNAQEKQGTLKLRLDDLMKQTCSLENEISDKERQIKKA